MASILRYKREWLYAIPLFLTLSLACSFHNKTSPKVEKPGEYKTEISKEQQKNTKESIIVKEIALKIHKLINKIRKENGLNTLKWDEKLSLIAEGHSKDMRDRGYFAHLSPEGENPLDRAEKMDYHCERVEHHGDSIVIWFSIGENILLVSGYRRSPDEIAKEAVDMWMSSEGHRQNILNPQYTREGIGVAADSLLMKFWITQDFSFCE